LRYRILTYLAPTKNPKSRLIRLTRLDRFCRNKQQEPRNSADTTTDRRWQPPSNGPKHLFSSSTMMTRLDEDNNVLNWWLQWWGSHCLSYFLHDSHQRLPRDHHVSRRFHHRRCQECSPLRLPCPLTRRLSLRQRLCPVFRHLFESGYPAEDRQENQRRLRPRRQF